MLGDYSEFENICKVLECSELVKSSYGICLMMFQHVSPSSYARHLTKICPKSAPLFRHVKIRLFCVPVHENRSKRGRQTPKQFPSMKRAVFVDGNSRSMRSELFGVARATCFEQLAGVFPDWLYVSYRRYENPHYLAPTVSFYVSWCTFWYRGYEF